MVSYQQSHTHLDYSKKTSNIFTRLSSQPDCQLSNPWHNILDLCFTSHPNIISTCNSIPGFSDHDTILASLSVSFYQQKQEPRRVPLYKKANWDIMQSRLSNLSNEYFNLKSAPQSELSMKTGPFFKKTFRTL